MDHNKICILYKAIFEFARWGKMASNEHHQNCHYEISIEKWWFIVIVSFNVKGTRELVASLHEVTR